MAASAAAPMSSRRLRWAPSAVLVGRPVLHGLATGGAHGAAHVLRLLIDELEIAMALCGCRTLNQIAEHHLHG